MRNPKVENESEWPQVALLPSYGVGRDAPGGRYSSLIFGTNLTDVVITGNNGTIDGQGAYWWDKFHKGELNLTRPYLIEIMYSDQIQISDLTLVNSPSWFVHPIYSKNVIIQGLTILAPIDSPNTDGIDPGFLLQTLQMGYDFSSSSSSLSLIILLSVISQIPAPTLVSKTASLSPAMTALPSRVDGTSTVSNLECQLKTSSLNASPAFPRILLASLSAVKCPAVSATSESKTSPESIHNPL